MGPQRFQGPRRSQQGTVPLGAIGFSVCRLDGDLVWVGGLVNVNPQGSKTRFVPALIKLPPPRHVLVLDLVRA